VAGSCSAANRAKLDNCIRRCKRLGYCDNSVPPFSGIFSDVDDSLSDSIMTNSNHVLCSYLPERRYPILSQRKSHCRTLEGNEWVPQAWSSRCQTPISKGVVLLCGIVVCCFSEKKWQYGFHFLANWGSVGMAYYPTSSREHTLLQASLMTKFTNYNPWTLHTLR